MKRHEELLRFISKEALGIEIAPYFNPLTPKSKGYNCRVVDVFGEDDLRAKADKDPMIPDARIGEIEPVDFVGDASQLSELLKGSPEFGAFDYIVSSHNFEHLPNPIRFLTGCEEVLRPGGVLSMAIPDYRACFDYFRFPTRLADWIDAYHEDRNQPSPESVLDARLGTAFYRKKDGIERPGFKLGTAHFEDFTFSQNLSEIYQEYLDQPKHYVDTHCSVTCPEIFHLLISDLMHLGLTGFEIVSISKTRSFEYFVHLRKPENLSRLNQDSYKTQRPHLLEEARRAASYSNGGGVLNRLIERVRWSSTLDRLTGRRSSGQYVIDQT